MPGSLHLPTVPHLTPPLDLSGAATRYAQLEAARAARLASRPVARTGRRWWARLVRVVS